MFEVMHSGWIGPDDVAGGLSLPLREAMLDVVLAWGSIDGAISELYTAVFGLREIDHADEVSDMSAQKKLRDIQIHVRAQSPDLSRSIARLKKRFEKCSKTRDIIAHCRCVGHLKLEPERAVFLRYRKLGEEGLCVDAIHIDKFREISAFGRRLFEAVMVTAGEYRGVR